MPLPGAKKEVEVLSREFDGAFFFGAAAHERNFKNQIGNYGILHLAMHGYADDENPDYSGLRFTEVRDTIEDDTLFTYELYNMAINAHLAVLSACETGFGKAQRGEGIMSLARGFQYAGVQSIIMSLWKTNDLSSSFIMNEFYEELVHGSAKDEALRKAKLKFLQQTDEIRANPAYWAAYSAMGDMRPLKLTKRKKQHPVYWFVGIVVLGISAFVFRKRRKSKALFFESINL